MTQHNISCPDCPEIMSPSGLNFYKFRKSENNESIRGVNAPNTLLLTFYCKFTKYAFLMAVYHVNIQCCQNKPSKKRLPIKHQIPIKP